MELNLAPTLPIYQLALIVHCTRPLEVEVTRAPAAAFVARRRLRHPPPHPAAATSHTTKYKKGFVPAATAVSPG